MAKVKARVRYCELQGFENYRPHVHNAVVYGTRMSTPRAFAKNGSQPAIVLLSNLYMDIPRWCADRQKSDPRLRWAFPLYMEGR